ncbi:MAG: hypothetical protein AB7R90_13165 [Reyranellaceae bacterium]
MAALRCWLAGFLVATLVAAPALAQSADQIFARYPRQDVPGKQIGWWQDSYKAFVHALENEKAMVVVFGDHTSPMAAKFAELVVPCPQLNQLAGAAVFVYGTPQGDEFARRMAMHFKLQVYPTVSVVAPRTDRLTELYRAEGFTDAATLAGDLERTLRGNRLWPADQPKPAPLTTHYLAYAGKACTPEGARRLNAG